MKIDLTRLLSVAEVVATYPPKNLKGGKNFLRGLMAGLTMAAQTLGGPLDPTYKEIEKLYGGIRGGR